MTFEQTGSDLYLLVTYLCRLRSHVTIVLTRPMVFNFFLFQEVSLQRTNSCDRLGLTLCYGTADEQDTDIFVSEVREEDSWTVLFFRVGASYQRPSSTFNAIFINSRSFPNCFVGLPAPIVCHQSAFGCSQSFSKLCPPPAPLFKLMFLTTEFSILLKLRIPVSRVHAYYNLFRTVRFLRLFSARILPVHD